MSEDTAIKLFEEKKIRSVWDEKSGEWYFSIVDIIGALTDSVNSKDYFKKLRKRDTELDAYVGTNCPLVSMLTETGKHRQTLAGNAKNILRIVQSIPSPKAEPFKIWLAEIGYERLQEIENPELAQERMKSLRTKNRPGLKKIKMLQDAAAMLPVLQETKQKRRLEKVL